MTSRRIEGMDELVVQADIPRVFGVTVDAVRDLGAAIDGGDLEKVYSISATYAKQQNAAWQQ